MRRRYGGHLEKEFSSIGLIKWCITPFGAVFPLFVEYVRDPTRDHDVFDFVQTYFKSRFIFRSFFDKPANVIAGKTKTHDRTVYGRVASSKS